MLLGVVSFLVSTAVPVSVWPFTHAHSSRWEGGEVLDGRLVHTFIKAFLCLAPFGVMWRVREVLPSQSLHAHRENCASNE